MISKQPQPAECSFGDSVSFEIEAESFELLSYQWYKDDEKLLGTISFSYMVNSVADPYVFGPPGSGSGSSSQRYGSGSFYYQAKIVRKTLILLFCDFFLSLKMM